MASRKLSSKTKMTYLRQSNRERDRRNRPTVIVGSIIACCVVIQLIFPQFFASIILRTVVPLLQVRHDVQVRIAPDGGYASTTPEGLQATVAELTEENLRLKEVLGRSPRSAAIIASVVTLPPQSPYDTMIVDAGYADGVYVNRNVYASTTLIGKVTEVYQYSSKITLFSSPDTTYDILIGKDNIRATAVGKGSGVYEAVIPREYKVSAGDPISIPTLFSGVFGTVETVVVDPVRAFESVYFKTPVNLQQLRWVSIEK